MEVQERAQELMQESRKVLQELEAWKQARQAADPTRDLYQTIEGLQKLTSAIVAEIRFLEKVVSTPPQAMKPVQITSSNLPYLRALVRALVRANHPVAVRKTFEFSLGDYLFLEPAGKWTGQFAFEALAGSSSSSSTRPGGEERIGRDAATPGGGRAAVNLKKNSPSSQNTKNAATAPPTFQVKVDLVADHGTSWLRVNAGSVWSLVHEFAGMEDDSDDDDDEEDDDNEEEEDDDDKDRERKRRPPVHVSKDTHPDLAIQTRSLVLAADQNRIHYHHVPKITLHFAGIQPNESKPLEGMLFRAIETARYSQSMAPVPCNRRVPIQVVMGSDEDHQAILPGGGAGGIGARLGGDLDEAAERPGRKGQRRILLDQDRNMAKELVSALAHDELDTLFGMTSQDGVAAKGEEEKDGSKVVKDKDDDTVDKYGPYQVPKTVDDMAYFTTTLNLDITTLMALSSWLCHTFQPDPAVFSSPPLRFQAQQECDQPVLPVLATILRASTRLVVTRSAATRFLTIVNLIGGPEEQWRGRVLLRQQRQQQQQQRGLVDDFKRAVGLEEEKEAGLAALVASMSEAEIAARWQQRSEWCSRFPQLFPDGPPRIEVIDDVSVDFQPPLPKPPPKQRNRKRRVPQRKVQQQKEGVEEEEEEQEQVDPDGRGSIRSGASTPTSLVDETTAELSTLPASSNRQDYRDNKQGRAEWLKEQEMMELHTKIFMAGYQHQITTLTANLVGYRAVLRTGNVPAKLSVWFHTPRSLAEAKVGNSQVSLTQK